MRIEHQGLPLEQPRDGGRPIRKPPAEFQPLPHPGTPVRPGVDPLDPPGFADPGGKLRELKKAAGAFESILFKEMIHSMLEGSTESGFFGNSEGGEAVGGETYQGLLEDGLSTSLGSTGGLGVADQVYRQFEAAVRLEKPAALRLDNPLAGSGPAPSGRARAQEIRGSADQMAGNGIHHED